MPLHVDSYFAMGKTHTVCQDYAATLNSCDTVVLAVSDGCSSSPDTDFGSRFLVRTGIRDCTFAGPSNAGSWNGILQSAKRAQEVMGLPYHSLDATLLLAHVHEGKIYVRMWGDGVVSVKFKDGTYQIIEVEFEDNTPAYLSYLGSESALSRYTARHGLRNVKVYDADGLTTTKKPVTMEEYNLSWTFDLAEVEALFLLSDGASSFRQRHSSTSWQPISLLETLAMMTDIKNPNGEFMVRRMRKFLYEFCPKNNWIHEDDIAIAALVNVE